MSRLKREHGAGMPPNSVTAPATVSGEQPRRTPLSPLGSGRVGEALTRKSGNLPSRVRHAHLSHLNLGGVPWDGETPDGPNGP